MAQLEVAAVRAPHRVTFGMQTILEVVRLLGGMIRFYSCKKGCEIVESMAEKSIAIAEVCAALKSGVRDQAMGASSFLCKRPR